MGLAFLGAIPKPALAFDAIPTVDPDLANIEKKRREREEGIAKNKAKIKPYLSKIAAATNQQQFADATDELAAFIIGEGRIPEGIEATALRDAIVDSYQNLPLTLKYKAGEPPPPGMPECDYTRTNKGICFSPGALAEDAKRTCIGQLRRLAKSKGGVSAATGKGALISDGVSAANSAAF